MSIELINIGWATFCSFLITYLCIPQVLHLAFQKQLFDVPDERKVHTVAIPSLGGIGIFIGVLITFTFFHSEAIFHEYKYLATAYLILFFTGLKDDLTPIDAKIKFVIQIFCAFIIVQGGIRITDLHGFMGIDELNLAVSYFISILFIVGVTNAYNLIDGIDGLAGGLGGINCITFGTLLLWVGANDYALLGFIVAGALLAFLRYNFASYPDKIFMGDAGSLLLGLTVTILSIKFIEAPGTLSVLSIVSPPAIVAAIIAIPVFDTLRVFTLRILNGKSPFSPDKSHIHHAFLASGFSHKSASIALYIINLLLIINVLTFKSESAFHLILLTLMIGAFVVQAITLWNYYNRQQLSEELKEKLSTLEKENHLL